MHNTCPPTQHKIKTLLIATGAMALVCQVLIAKPTHAASEAPISVSTRIIVKFRPTANDAQKGSGVTAAIRSISRAEVSGQAEALSGQAFRLNIALSNAEALTNTLATLNASPDVEFAEVDEIFQPTEIQPNDPLFAKQTQYQATQVLSDSYGINLPQAWAITTGVPTMTVAVIDTGIRPNHPEFAGRILPGYDFVNSATYGNDGDGRDSDPSDPGDGISTAESTDKASLYYGCPAADSTWHGTAMAGLLGATGNNNEGVAGVNWQAKILPLRVLGKCGGSSSDIADAIRWAAGLDVPGAPRNSNPAQVMNLSLGRPGRCSATLQSAIDDATATGAILVVAAGNSGINASNASPANCKNVVVVGASTLDGYRTSYSNYGETVDIAAPGGSTVFNSDDALLTASDEGKTQPQNPTYKAYRGTSISTAVASGVISLMKAVNPSLSTSEVISILQKTATAYSNADTCSDSMCASGIINASAAVAAARDYRPTTAHGNNPITVQIFLPTLMSNKTNGIVASESVVAISNGDFETGNTIWSTATNNSAKPVIVDGTQLPSGVTPYQGKNVAWLGGINNANSYFEQTLVVPTEAPILTLHSRIQSSDSTCKQDMVFLLINGQTAQRYMLCSATMTGDWSTRRIDLSTFAGQQVSLKFHVTTNATDISQMFIDALQFESK